MLNRLLASTTRPRVGLLFAKPSVPINMSRSLRTLSGLKTVTSNSKKAVIVSPKSRDVSCQRADLLFPSATSGRRKTLKMSRQERAVPYQSADLLLVAFALGAVATAGLVVSIVRGISKGFDGEMSKAFKENVCASLYIKGPKPTSAEAGDAQPKKPSPIEGARIGFITANSLWTLNWFDKDSGTAVFLPAVVFFHLPNFRDKASIKEICEGLKRHGVVVDECSEAGLRLALTEYALYCMREGANRHYKQRCNCKLAAPILSFSQWMDTGRIRMDEF